MKIILLMFGFSILFAGEPDGAALLDDLMQHMNPEQSHAIMKQIIQTSSGGTREMKYESWTMGKGEMSLMRYVEPTRVKGNALLMKDFSDKIWMFNKRTKRTRMLASSAKKQKFEGSDFSYEDMGSGDSWKEDYLPSNKGIKKINKEDCYEVELIPTLASNISYSKLVCYMRVKDVFPVRFDYYDEKGELLKMLHLENIKDIQGVLTPMVMRMENVLDKTETIMEYINIDYSVKLKESFFNERNLGR